MNEALCSSLPSTLQGITAHNLVVEVRQGLYLADIILIHNKKARVLALRSQQRRININPVKRLFDHSRLKL